MKKASVLNSKNSKRMLQEAINKTKNEVLIGIDPNSYLGKEILRQSLVIIDLRHKVMDISNEIELIKRERQKKSCLKKILLSIINKLK